MYSTTEYRNALVRLGNSVDEIHRRMLVTHASAPDYSLDVLALAKCVGQDDDNFTYSKYGHLGKRLANSLGSKNNPGVWTRLIGRDSRDPETGYVRWQMHPSLAAAVFEMDWGIAPVIWHEQADKRYATATTQESLVFARVGQDKFRSYLVSYWGSCAVTGCTVLEALVASHVKAWAQSTDIERLDVFNGLLLLGTLDRLFDNGLVSFDSDGLLMVNAAIPSSARRLLGLDRPRSLRKMDHRHRPYLEWHRHHHGFD